jgi:hypothetical protein
MLLLILMEIRDSAAGKFDMKNPVLTAYHP